VGEAEAHAAEDKGRRESIEKHNQLDSLIYNAEKMLRENGDKLPADEKKRLEETLLDAKKDLESGDAGRLEAARQRVEQATHKAAELLYKAQTGGSAGGAAADEGQKPGPGADGDVIDAEYTEEKGGAS